MTATVQRLAICLAAVLLAACSVTTSREIVAARTAYTHMMDSAAGRIQTEDWNGALSDIDAALAALPFHEEEAVEDGNFAYLAIQAEALEAYVTLVSGDTDGAEHKYDTLFRKIARFEADRETAFRSRVGSARIWEAFGNAVYSAASAHSWDAGSGEMVQVALQDFSQTLIHPLPAPLDAGHLSGRTLDADGIRLTVMPTVGPFARIARLASETGTCTAGLIGNRLALTNAHCVTSYEQVDGHGIAQGAWPLKSGPVYLLFEGLYAPDRVRVVDVELNGGDHWVIAEDHDYSGDWAILFLDRHPAGRGWFGITDLGTFVSTNVFIAGHSADLNDGRFITVDWDCAAASDAGDDLILHGCTATGGSSGSPILLTSGPYRFNHIIGLNAFTADRSSGRAPYGGGPKLSRVMEILESLRPSG